jgi:hypothetical protein
MARQSLCCDLRARNRETVAINAFGKADILILPGIAAILA